MRNSLGGGWFALLFAAILAATPNVLPGAEEEPRLVRVASWNVEHFVDANDDPYVDNDQENGGGKSEEVLNKMAAVMLDLNADVLVLQEVEGEAWVRDYARRYLPEAGYTRIVGTRDEDWHQNIVILSRLPLGALTTLKAAESTDGADGKQFFLNGRMMMVEVVVDESYSFLLGGLHLKAGAADKDRATRIGQIELFKRHAARILQTLPGGNLLVVGDMNLAPTNPEFEALTKSEYPLRSAFEEWGFPPTHPSEYPARHIDMILTNDAMWPELVPGSAAVATPLALEEMMPLSDHLPVVVTIQAAEATAP